MTTAATTTTTSLAPGICNLSSTEQELYLPPHGNSHGVTPAVFDNGDATVVLPDYAGYAYGRYVLGPAEMSGSIIKTAAANLNSQTDEWEVDMSFTGKGSALFNKYAAAHYQCYVQDTSNPPYCALQAIELDATVESAPAIEAASFTGGATINGSTSDPFTVQQASDLALALSYGSLPVRFVAQDISNVSPQIGTDSLKAGAIAGAVAVLLVLIYLIIYYRALGPGGGDRHLHVRRLYLRHNDLAERDRGPALTLVGGDRLDRLRRCHGGLLRGVLRAAQGRVRIGRTVRTSVEKGFKRAFRTILAADFSSFIAALILYTLTVGDVRGFAFFLGLATLLNVVTTYFFTRPLVIFMGRRAALGEGGFLGVNRGLGEGHWAHEHRPDLTETSRGAEPRREHRPDGTMVATPAPGCTGARPTTTSSTAGGTGSPFPGPSSPSAWSPSASGASTSASTSRAARCGRSPPRRR